LAKHRYPPSVLPQKLSQFSGPNRTSFVLGLEIRNVMAGRQMPRWLKRVAIPCAGAVHRKNLRFWRLLPAFLGNIPSASDIGYYVSFEL